jgi:hypothetical protein
VADSLEKGTDHEDEYMISEKELIVNKYVLFLLFQVCVLVSGLKPDLFCVLRTVVNAVFFHVQLIYIRLLFERGSNSF